MTEKGTYHVEISSNRGTPEEPVTQNGVLGNPDKGQGMSKSTAEEVAATLRGGISKPDESTIRVVENT